MPGCSEKLRHGWRSFAARGWFAVLAATLAASLFLPAGVLAQYPNKPIRMVISFPPGGAADVMGRIVAGKLRESMGQPFVVDNKAGAAGVAATEFVAHSAPDGYTILYAL